MCLSTRYVANTVKQVLKMTASSCIENALMQRAKTLLHTTNKSIQEIAEQLGFQNQSHSAHSSNATRVSALWHSGRKSKFF